MSGAPRWATCALTQLGFVRLSSNPAIVAVLNDAILLTLDQRLAPPGAARTRVEVMTP